MRKIEATILTILNLLIYSLFPLSSCKQSTEANQGKFSGVSLSEEQKKRLQPFTITEDQPTEIVIKNFDQTLSSNIVTDVSYVKLETTAESLIGEVSKIIVQDDRIFIMDSFVSNNLFVFSINGKFIAKIKNFGEGPNEIKQVYDFYIDSKKQEVVVFDGALSRLVSYDYNLIPKGQKKLYFRFSNMRLMPGGKLLLHVDAENNHIPEIDRYNVLLLDSSLNIIRKGFQLSKEEEKNNYTLIDHLHQSDEKSVAWVPKFKNSVFSFTEDGNVQKRFVLDFKKREVPSEYYTRSTDDLMAIAKDRHLYYYYGDYEENSNTVYFKITTPLIRDQISVFFDKTSQNYIYGKIKMDNINLPFLGLPVTSYQDRFVTFIEPQYIESIKKGKVTGYTIPNELKNMSNVTEEGDNPIIQFYKITTTRNEESAL